MKEGHLLCLMLVISVLMLATTLAFPPVRAFAQFTLLTDADLGQCLVWSLLGVVWVEGYKFWKRR